MKNIIIVAALCAPLLTGCIKSKDGEKVGIVTRVSREGIFCKTWEAEMVRGGMSGGTGTLGGIFRFTIENQDLVAKVKDAVENQKEIKIRYHKEALTFCRSHSSNDKTPDGVSTDSNYFLDSIEYR